MLKKLFKFVYVNRLCKKWKIKKSSAVLLVGTFLRDYKNKKFSYAYIHKIHAKGFSVDDWRFCGLNKENYKEYLSTVQYYGMHPINGKFSKWIDDKLTLKYLCHGTALQKYMPEYYYQISEDGKIIPLMDCQEGQRTVASILTTLREKKRLAIKLISGSIGEGFIKAEYKDNKYFLNGKEYIETEIISRINSLRNYLITEYFKPHQELAKFCPNTCNAIRYLIGYMPNGEIKMLKSFIRFGTQRSGFVENYNAGGVLCYIDENGFFNKGNAVDLVTRINNIVCEHPDTKMELKGRIPCWDEIVESGKLFGRVFPQMHYLGIDYVITDAGEVKVIEINSLSSLDALQLDGSILQSTSGDFYKQRLN